MGTCRSKLKNMKSVTQVPKMPPEKNKKTALACCDYLGIQGAVITSYY